MKRGASPPGPPGGFATGPAADAPANGLLASLAADRRQRQRRAEAGRPAPGAAAPSSSGAGGGEVGRARGAAGGS